MSTKLLTATEAARHFSDVLDRVSQKGASYDIRRGREIVARLVPARPAPGRLKVPELAALLAKVPRLSPDDVERFDQDLAKLRRRLRPARDPWN